MSQQIIGIGSAPNDGTGDDLRTAGDKINDNFTELYGLAGGGAILQGVHSIPIPAAAMVPRTTAGCADLASAESSTNKIMLRTLDFDQTTDEHAQVMIPMPPSWDEGPVAVQFLWMTSGSADNVVWGCRAVALSDGDTLDAAFGTEQTVTDAVTGAGDLMISPPTPWITIAGSPARGDLVVFEFYRDANNGADDLAADAQLLAVRILYVVDEGDDS